MLGGRDEFWNSLTSMGVPNPYESHAAIPSFLHLRKDRNHAQLLLREAYSYKNHSLMNSFVCAMTNVLVYLKLNFKPEVVLT